MLGNNQVVNPWTKEEEEYLVNNYKSLGKFELAKELSKRTPGAIKRKLVRMGLFRSREESFKIKRRMQSGENHWNYGKQNTEAGRLNMRISQQKRFMDPKQREKMREIRFNQIFPKKDTSIEVKIQNFLKDLGIDFFTHQHIDINHSYQCDILIPSENLIIECDGDYWHKYPAGTDIDRIRTKEIQDKGFRVWRIWGSEIEEMEPLDFALSFPAV